MKKLAAMGALGLMASCLYSQGLNPGGQMKDDWEEINFEFNSSILSDGYPSLLRLAELLSQHRDYKVRVVGNTDYVGSVPYNDKLALARANTVRDFLIKYGANADQITTAGNGKGSPEVNNNTKEGRFMNRRVVLTVTNAQGAVVKEGGINDILKAIQDLAAKQEDCCNQILRRLDKLDDILAALKNMQGENDKLRAELDDLRNQHNMLRDQVAALPKPLTGPETTNIARTEATTAANNALEEAQRRNKKFSLVGLNVGPSWGPNRFGNGDFTVSGRGQFFSPFGGDGTRAVQAQGEYMYYPGRQEGQFDIGLVNRWGHMQAGAFGSFKAMSFREYQNAGFLGQGSFLLDYIFSRGRLGAFATAPFKSNTVLNSANLGPSSFLQTYAHLVSQYGVNALVGAWGNAYVEANVGYLRMREASDMPGAKLKLVQPLNDKVSFTTEFGLNESFVGTSDKGSITFGLEFGNYIRPKDYGTTMSPVPMDVPRVRYQLLTRRVGNSAPVADAGPNQVVPPGTVTLNGSGSFDPDGTPLTFSWQQIGGASVTLSGANTATPTFTAVAGQIYSFRLTVKNAAGLQSSASTTVTTSSAVTLHIDQFFATPNNIQPGQSSTLSWSVTGATSVTISGGVGNVNATSGTTQVTPQQTTTYTLTANGPGGPVTANAVITVGGITGPVQIVRFEASPLTIAPGQQSTLSWSTNNATQVSISGVGNVTPNGSTTVSPAQTTTYTLTATGANGQAVTAPITVTVATGTIPQVVTFVATPQNIDAGQSTQLCWQVTNATSISITPGVGTNLSANDCAAVSPTTTTTYTLTATNATGQIQANATVNVGQVRILSFNASPVFSAKSGDPVTLSWTTSNATSVVLVGNVQPQVLPVNGTVVVNPITNTTFTLTAYGPGGQTVSVTIEVFVR
jgi:K319-like protein/OmpA family protein